MLEKGQTLTLVILPLVSSEASNGKTLTRKPRTRNKSCVGIRS